MNFRPQASLGQSGGDLGSSPATGSQELGGAGLSAGVEGQLSNNSVSDVSSAQNFFSGDNGASSVYGQLDLTSAAAPHAPLAGAESLSLAQPPVTGFEQAMFQAPMMPGAESNVLAGVLAGANEPISPIIQLIMKLPGAMGLMNSFFEFFSTFFFSQTSFFDLLNPAFLGAQAYTAISHTVHHMPLSLSMLPAHAPIFQTMNTLGHPMFTSDLLSAKLNLSMGHAASSSIGSNSLNTFKSSFNVSSGIDLNKPVFEGVPLSGQSAGGTGVLSGPSLSDMSPSNHLANNTRLFSDKIAGGNLNNIRSSATSQTQVPNTLTNSVNNQASTSISGMQSNSIASGYQVNPGSNSLQNSISENLMGNHGTVEPAGFNYGNPANNLASESSTLGPSGAVSNQLGSKNLLAMDNSSSGFGPTISEAGERLKEVINPTGSGDGMSSGGHIAGLKAKQLTLDSVKTSTDVSKASPQLQAPKAAQPVHHKAAPTSHHKTASHHAKPHHSKPVSRKLVSEKPSETVSNNNVESSDLHSDNQLLAQAEPNLESVSYTIKPGDNLWNIAKESMGDGLKWHDVFDMNKDVLGANPDLIYPGTTIELPGSMAEIAQNGASNYVVQPGDNLWSISKNFLGEGHKWGDVYQLNDNVIGSNPSLIHPGQNLALPSNDPTGQALSHAANPAPQAPANEMTTAPTGSDSMAESVPDTKMNTEIQSTNESGVESYGQGNQLNSGNSPNVSYDFVQSGGNGNSFNATVSQAPTPAAQAGFPVISANSQPIAGGAGAAYAATSSSGNTSVVSSGLMSDLTSFLGQKK